MKIYTKTGDKGTTGLIGGDRILKNHIRIESYGTVDELNSWVGVLCSNIFDVAIIEELRFIQDRLFTIGSNLAMGEKSQFKVPSVQEMDIEKLEKSIDAMNESLPELKNFILPGGSQVVSFCHVCRTVCRRAERNVISLDQVEKQDELYVKYLNRLSDYLFVLSRYIAFKSGEEEIIWKPR